VSWLQTALGLASKETRNILCNWNSEKNVEEILKKYIFPKNERDEVGLPDVNDLVGEDGITLVSTESA